MANYNPHAPQNLGQEWVPIRDEDLIYNPYANSFERGYGFSLTSTRNVNNVRAYVNRVPDQFIMDRAFTASIYPRGYEDQSGPVRRVIIPCTGGVVTGSDPASWQFIAVSTVADAFFNPSSQQAIIYRVGFTYGSSTYMWFGVSSYQNLLQNKRILGVNFLTSIDVGNSGATANTQESMQLWMANDNAIVQNPGAGGFVFDNAGAIRYPNLFTPTTPTTDVRFDRIRLGDVARFQGTTGFNPATPNMNVTQWTYSELARFEASAANRINMAFFIPIAGVQFGFTDVIVSYAALEVFYCEESRAGFGTRLVQVNNQNLYWPGNYIGNGAMPIVVKTPTGSPLILQPGDYTVTLSESNFGDSYNGLRTPGRHPNFNESRQLYEIPTVPGVEVTIPFPLNDGAINQTLTAASTKLIPQLSLHASGSGGTLFESHPYGRQTRGEVINASNTTVQQAVDTSFIGGLTSATYPWIRYWARRYGDTSGSLRAKLLTSEADISAQDFDALDEIVDGWREVTLRFDIAPTLNSVVHPIIEWLPTLDQNAGNRWEVLGAGAPALTGMPGSNQLTTVASPNTLTIATYGSPVSGGIILETWRPGLGPYVSAPAADATSDVSFILAQDPFPVTGFGVVTTSMAVSGIGRDCGIDPCCIPTAILYNQVSWSGPPATLGPGHFSDSFETDSTAGWPPTSDGDVPYLHTVGPLTDYTVSGGQGKMRITATGVTREALLGSGIRNSDQIIAISVPAVALTQTINSRLVARYIDDNNRWALKVEFDTSGNIDLGLNKLVAGVSTFVASANNVTTYSANSLVYARLQVEGDTLRAKAWANTLAAEPSAWQIQYTEMVPQLYMGKVGLIDDITTGNTNTLPLIISHEDYTVNNPQTFGYTELQRMDTVDTDWQTIMKASSPYTTSFKDYEARVGISSSYRIRSVDFYGFYGPWSSTVSLVQPAPGVSGGCVSDGHLLIFTTNEVQDGTRNLAYSSVWMDEQVSEDFDFAEAGFVQMQAMYNRDFFVAFRPNERGGEQFSRTVLVQAAAISPPTLADFRSLRDLAWENLSYVCVRDEDGNRWLAMVQVPSGRVLRDRRLYLAPVNIVEVTDTPTEADPSPTHIH